MTVAGEPYATPHGSSINDYIDPESFSLTYCSVDDAYAMVNSLGTGALMSKIDLKNAFRSIHHLLHYLDDLSTAGVLASQEFSTSPPCSHCAKE